jgi:hypothetical protein
MARYIAVVFTDPRPGREAAFNDWYDHQHLDEIMATGAVQSARRFRAVDATSDVAPAQQFLTLYEFETEDLRQAKRMIAGGSSGSRETIMELVDTDSVVVRFFELITERMSE